MLTLHLPDNRPVGISGLEGWNDRELEAFCRANPVVRIERLTDGRLWLTPAPPTDAGRLCAHIGGQLGMWWRENERAGEFFASNVGFTLPDGSMRSPDASWVSAAKWQALTDDQRQHQFAPVCPEFVIELKSGSDSLRDLQRKMTDVWLANGTQLAFLLDADAEVSYVYRAGQPEAEVLAGFDRELSGEPVLPGFRLDLRLVR